MAEKIQALTRQDVINTATPQAFFGGTAGPAVKNSNLDQMVNALNNLIETGGKLALSEREEYKEDERKKGLVRMSTASPEQIENVRKGVDNNIIPASASPFFRQGANEGILKVYGRRFGEQALLNWKQSEEYTSTDPNAFSNWIQKYTETFNKDNHIQGFEEDLVADILIPAQNTAINIVQQRHQEKLNKEFEDNRKFVIKKDYVSELTDSYPIVKSLIKNLNANEIDAKIFNTKFVPVIDNILKYVKKGVKNKATQHQLNKELTPLFAKILKTDKKPSGFEGTVFYESVEAVHSALSDLYPGKGKNILNKKKGDPAKFQVGIKARQRFRLALERLEKVIENPVNAVNRLIFVNDYINTETEKNYKEGVNGKWVNDTMTKSIGEVAEKNVDKAYARFMFTSNIHGGSDSTKTIQDGTYTNIRAILKQGQTDKKLERAERKEETELNLKLYMVNNVPLNLNGTIDKTKLDAYRLEMLNKVNTSSYSPVVDVEKYIKALREQSSNPSSDVQAQLNQIFTQSLQINGPEKAYNDANLFALNRGYSLKMFASHEHLLAIKNSATTYSKDFYTRENSNLRKIIVETIGGTGTTITQDPSTGDWTVTGDVEKAQDVQDALDKIENFYTSTALDNYNLTEEQFREKLRNFVDTEILNPIKERAKSSADDRNKKFKLEKTLEDLGYTTYKELIEAHRNHKASGWNTFTTGIEILDEQIEKTQDTSSPVAQYWRSIGSPKETVGQWIQSLEPGVSTNTSQKTKSTSSEVTPIELPSIKDNTEIKVTDTIGDDSTDPNAGGPDPTLAEETSALAKKSLSKDIKRIRKQLQDELKRPPDINKLEENKPVLIKKQQKETKPVLTKKESARIKRMLLESSKIDAEANRNEKQEVEQALKEIRNRRTDLIP
jgi:hypothetical protein